MYAGCTEKEKVEMLNAGVSLEYIKKYCEEFNEIKKNKNDNIINIEKTEEVESENSVEIEKIDIKDYLNEDDKKKSKATNFLDSEHADYGLQIGIGLATMGIGISLEGIYFLDEQSSIRLSLAGSSKTNREEKNYTSNAFDDGRFGNTTRKITHEIETSSSIVSLIYARNFEFSSKWNFGVGIGTRNITQKYSLWHEYCVGGSSYIGFNCYALSDTKTERLNEEIYNSNNFIGILAAYWRDYQYSELGWFWGYDVIISFNLTKPSRSKPKKPGFLTQNDWEGIDGDSETKADLEKAINRPFVFFGIIGGYNF